MFVEYIRYKIMKRLIFIVTDRVYYFYILCIVLVVDKIVS